MSAKYYKIKRSIGITAFLLVFALANVMFWASWHNLDLLQNYSLLYNDFNREENCDEGFYDIRDASDCNLFGCGDFQQIYMESKTIEIFAYIFFNMLIADGIIRKIKRLDNEARAVRDNSSIQRKR